MISSIAFACAQAVPLAEGRSDSGRADGETPGADSGVATLPSEERELDAPALGRVPNTARLAFDGQHEYLLVWSDDSNGVFGTSGIFGVRVGLDGRVVDGNVAEIVPPAMAPTRPNDFEVVGHDGGFGLLWTRDGSAYFTTWRDGVRARIRQVIVVDSWSRRRNAARLEMPRLTLGVRGDEYVIAGGLREGEVDLELDVTVNEMADPIEVVALPGTAGVVDAAIAETSDGAYVRARLVYPGTRDAAPSASHIEIRFADGTSTNFAGTGRSAIASMELLALGSTVVLVWAEYGRARPDLYALRFRDAASIASAPHIALPIAGSGAPLVARNDEAVVVISSDERGRSTLVRIGEDPMDPVRASPLGDDRLAVIARENGASFVALTSDRAKLAVISDGAAPSVASAELPPLHRLRRTGVATACTESVCLVVWHEDRLAPTPNPGLADSDETELWARRFRRDDGAPLDARGFLVSAPNDVYGAPGDSSVVAAPCVAANGTKFLVGWASGREAALARDAPWPYASTTRLIDAATGTMSPPVRVSLNEHRLPAACGWDGASFVVLARHDVGRIGRTVSMYRVTEDGAPSSPRVLVDEVIDTVIAPSPSGSVIAWVRYPPSPGGAGAPSIEVALLPQGGSSLEARRTIASQRIGERQIYGEPNLAIATAGSTHAIAYFDTVASTAFVSLVSADLTAVADEIRIEPQSESRRPLLVGTGDGFVVAYERHTTPDSEWSTVIRPLALDGTLSAPLIANIERTSPVTLFASEDRVTAFYRAAEGRRVDHGPERLWTDPVRYRQYAYERRPH